VASPAGNAASPVKVNSREKRVPAAQANPGSRAKGRLRVRVRVDRASRGVRPIDSPVVFAMAATHRALVASVAGWM
jgi:hypothetical protein